jgi:hypothetical protein
MPMINIFGIEFVTAPDPTVPDVFNDDPSPVRLCEPLWGGLDGNVTTLDDLPGTYLFADVAGADFRFLGDPNIGLRYDTNGDFKVTKAESQQTGFSEGNFAYIPLDPVQTDPAAPDFMRFCRNYWLVIYGSTGTAQRDKYQAVLPNFPRPLGNGRPYADLQDYIDNATYYEKTVKLALVGAMEIIPTKYEDQVRVEGAT